MRTIVLASLLVAGCAPSISTVTINPPPRPLAARPAGEIEIYTTKLPTRAYVEVAVFTASKGKAENHIDALREHAAGHGCDALVFTRMPSQSNSSHAGGRPGELGSTSSSQTVGSSSATCVVWNDAAPGAPIPDAMPAAAPAQ